MRVLMFSWEFPPLIAGGLGIACYGIVKSLLDMGIEVDLVLPTKEEVYFPLRTVQDADSLPVVFVSPEKQREFRKIRFQTSYERLRYVGVSSEPETYCTPLDRSSVIRDVITMEGEYDEAFLRQVELHIQGGEKIFKKVREFTFRAETYARNLRYDIIHAHDWLTYPAGIVAKKISGRKLVSHIHATEFDRAGGPGDERVHNIEYAGMMIADAVIAVSQFTQELIIDRYHIDTRKIRVVHNAHEFDVPFTEKRRLFRAPTVLFLGRITLQKGPDYFLEAARLVLSKYPHVRFIMAGSGDMERRMLHQSAYYRLGNKFLFTGFLNRVEVAQILESADVYVMSSVSEPFGIAPLEAMAYGIATIISKQSGVSEVVENALKVDYWDVKEMAAKIIYLIDNPEERQRFACAGRLEVEKLRWDDAAQKIIAVYKEHV